MTISFLLIPFSSKVLLITPRIQNLLALKQSSDVVANVLVNFSIKFPRPSRADFSTIRSLKIIQTRPLIFTLHEVAITIHNEPQLFRALKRTVNNATLLLLKLHR